jgi:proline iminopeptidase
MLLYPKIEPYDEGMLDVGDGNHVFWETCGDPEGKPAVVLHGGPGSGSSPGARRFFDPNTYRVVLFDQRGCGQSKPHASDRRTDLSVNTTEHLLADMERLRQHLGIDRWLIFGGSWGSTLGLAYAERHPRRVSEIVFLGVTMTRRSEIDWLYRGVGPLFPEEWARFQGGVPELERDGDLVEAYYRLLNSSDSAVRDRAAKDWHEWEAALLSVDPQVMPPPQWSEPEFRLARARIVTHYFRHNAWLEEGILLREADALSGIPGVIVQGRLDLSSPPLTAWELARVWSESELVLVSGAGHSSADPGMSEAAIAAIDRFARRE